MGSDARARARLVRVDVRGAVEDAYRTRCTGRQGLPRGAIPMCSTPACARHGRCHLTQRCDCGIPDSFSQLKTALLEDAVNYGALPANVDGRQRHVFFCYVGEATSALKRGRAAMHAPHLEKFFGGTIGALATMTSADELTPAHVNGLLRAICKGAERVEVV
eukprot:GHVR01096925.1.p1 GENE.GHVR01096925.1~~GHVR01096925.1.p1  ORF type:complete len:162 (+),score=18.93 GHVR01096925.1:90-575(+)